MKRVILTSISLACLFSSFSQKTGSFTDERDGNTYKTVTVGTIEMMGENLRYFVPESYSFNNIPSNDAKYGRLYRWGIVMAGSEQPSTAGICPKGWHVPSYGEWLLVFNAFGGKREAGPALRDNGTSGLNLSLLGRYNKSCNCFDGLGEYGLYWTSDKSSRGPLGIILRPTWDFISADKMGNDGIYCRCVKD